MDTTAGIDSVLRALNQVSRRLERNLAELGSRPGPDLELRALAEDIIAALERAPNVALAAIYLNQIAGTYPVRHCVEAAIVAALLARSLGAAPDDVSAVAAAALTMNASMLRQPERFLPAEGSLSAEDRALIARHPREGMELLQAAGVHDPRWLEYVLLHHANPDQPDVPRNARLIGLADRYCSCVSARNYRRSMTPDAALALLSKVEPDPELVRCAAEQIGRFPPGALVRLQNGEVGVVASRLDAAGAVLVQVLRDGAGAPLPAGQQRRSGETGCGVAEALHEDQAGVRFSMKQVWGEAAAV